jgi:Holliday junction DNA helicase RuvB
MEFQDFIGNNLAVRKLKLVATDAIRGGEMPHLGFFGPPGCGKTTMGGLMAKYINRPFCYISGTAISEPKNLLHILREYRNGGLVLLDECHRLPGAIQDNMLPLLEKPCLLMIPNKSGKAISYPLPSRLTFILATTHIGQIRDALLSRLIKVEFFDYSIDERAAIAGRYLCRQGVPRESMDLDALMNLGARSRSPREIEQNADQVRRYMVSNNIDRLTVSTVDAACEIIGIDCNGLTRRDRDLLEYLSFFNHVGLKGLAANLNLPETDVLEKIEPWLIRNKLIRREPRGRKITEAGIQALEGKFVLI